MTIRSVIYLILILSFPAVIFTQEGESREPGDASYYEAEGLEAWQYEFNLSGYEPGTYNIIIEGLDKAGNTATAGPYNLYIDPDSDKPIVHIINPEPGMGVNGNVNIIGTCTDDDGVAYVELKINDGAYSRAEGTDFWSHFLNTDSLGDGPVSLSARGVDINGVTGDETLLSFTLDSRAPVTRVTSHGNGVLVNGKISLEGSVSDSNGVRSLEYSRDGGTTYVPLSLKGKKSSPEKTYRISVNTKELEDGPQIYWFRAVDNSGSEGLSSFLFFVDNSPPEISLIYPAADEKVNGKVVVAGYAVDEIGLSNLTCRSGKDDPEEILLKEGDPYWVKEFDFTGRDKGDIRFELTDRAGNVSEARLELQLDREGDKPLVTLVSPLPGEIPARTALAGFVSDDDGVEKILYSLDGGDPMEIPARYSFYESLEGLRAGFHRLEISAVDINGVSSDTQKVDFTIAGAKPQIRMDRYIPLQGEGSVSFVQGGEIEEGLYKSLEGAVFFANPAAEVFGAWDGGGELKISPKKQSDSEWQYFSLSLKDILPGYHTLHIRLADQAGLTEEKTYFFFLKGETAPGAEKMLYTGDERFRSGGKPVDNPVDIREDNPLVFYLGEQAVRAELSAEADFLSVKREDHRVIVSADSPGYAGDLTLEIETSSGKTYQVGPFSVIRDDQVPSIALDEERSDRVYRDGFLLSGTVADDTEVTDLSLSVNGGAFSSVEREEGRFNRQVDFQALGEGDLHFVLKAEDRAGCVDYQEILVRKDSTPPALKQLTPVPGRSINGVISYTGLIGGESGGSVLTEYSPDGENYLPLEGENFPRCPIDLTPGAEAFAGSFRLTDEAGNTEVFMPDLTIDEEGDLPLVQIQIPSDDYLAERDFLVSGMAFDDDRVKSIKYRIDEGEFVLLEGGNNFEIPLALQNLTDNSHLLEVIAVDLNDVESKPAFLNFHVSRDKPVSELTAPALGEIVRGDVLLTGMSRDNNGIGSVYLSYDNGNTFNRIPVEEGGEQSDESVSWHYLFNTEMLRDGRHSLLVRAVDKYGASSLYTTMINVDNTPPVLSLSEPAEGARISGETVFKGLASDNRGLSDIGIEFKSLSGASPGQSLELNSSGTIFEELDMSSFEPGWVNMRLTATDITGNESIISRNLFLTEREDLERVLLLSPASGSDVTDRLIVQGRVENMAHPGKTTILFDGVSRTDLELSERGYFHYALGKDDVTEGVHTLRISQKTEEGNEVLSEPVEVTYSSRGPWISIDSFQAGDFITQRPWLSGTTGYNFSPPALEGKELEKYNRTKEAELIEISLDNGRSFRPASGSATWKFRLETQELEAGELWILARARFADGTTAVTKTLVLVDENPPSLDLITPAQEGMRFNGILALSGTGEDENGLDSVNVALRKGDKNRYEVPAFIQGLYIDMHFMGSSFFELGAGLTFFDDNVKLQGQLGYAPPGRFSGFVSGVKLLANIAVIPWNYYLGYDFKDFSSSVTMGTVFNYFSMSDSSPFGSDGVILGAFLTQIELVKWKNPDWKYFSAFGFYTEAEFWFISSDINAGIEPRLTFGLRTDVF